MSLPDCQRTKCGAKNFLGIPICLYSQNYFFGTVEDQFDVKYSKVEDADWETCASVLNGVRMKELLSLGW
jgi:hypothetical protein